MLLKLEHVLESSEYLVEMQAWIQQVERVWDLHFLQAPSCADAAGLRTTLWVERCLWQWECQGWPVLRTRLSLEFLCSSLPCNFKACFPKSDWESLALSSFYFHSVIESVVNWLFLISNSLHLMTLYWHTVYMDLNDSISRAKNQKG